MRMPYGIFFKSQCYGPVCGKQKAAPFLLYCFFLICFLFATPNLLCSWVKLFSQLFYYWASTVCSVGKGRNERGILCSNHLSHLWYIWNLSKLSHQQTRVFNSQFIFGESIVRWFLSVFPCSSSSKYKLRVCSFDLIPSSRKRMNGPWPSLQSFWSRFLTMLRAVRSVQGNSQKTHTHTFLLMFPL